MTVRQKLSLLAWSPVLAGLAVTWIGWLVYENWRYGYRSRKTGRRV